MGLGTSSFYCRNSLLFNLDQLTDLFQINFYVPPGWLTSYYGNVSSDVMWPVMWVRESSYLSPEDAVQLRQLATIRQLLQSNLFYPVLAFSALPFLILAIYFLVLVRCLGCRCYRGVSEEQRALLVVN